MVVSFSCDDGFVKHREFNTAYKSTHLSDNRAAHIQVRVDSARSP
jgi:acetolactate synthase regulatory subunit